MKCRLPVAAFAFLAALFASTRGVAQTTINVGTSATGFASYDPFSGGGGPYPFSNFGVAASANIGGTSVNLVTGGQTSFLFPAFSNGQVIAPNAIGTAIGYTPGWTGSIDSASTLAANATFVYNIGPFSGSNTLFNQNLTNAVSGSLVSGGTLMGGNLGGVSNGNLTSFGYSAGAPFASASATTTSASNIKAASPGAPPQPMASTAGSAPCPTAPRRSPTSPRAPSPAAA